MATAASIAELLCKECSILLELYRKKESFLPEITVPDNRLVSVETPSSPLDRWGKLCSALLQCHRLMDRAGSKEEDKLGTGKKGEYENQRDRVKDRLLLLTKLLKSTGGSAALTTVKQEVDCPTSLFELKLWVYRVFKEVDYWARLTFQALSAEKSKEPVRAMRARSKRSARRLEEGM